MTRTLTALAIAALLAPLPVLPAAAQEVEAKVSTIRAQGVDAQSARVRELELSADPASKIDLARLLIDGLPAGEGNPLLRPDFPRAETLLRELIGGSDPGLADRARALLVDLLTKRGTPADIAEGDKLVADLLSRRYPPLIARYVLDNRPLPPDLPADAAVAALEPAVLAGDSKATAALSRLLVETDPERSKLLASQSLVLDLAGSARSVSSAAESGLRYLRGIGIPPDRAEGLRLLREAAGKGSDFAIRTLHEEFSSGASGLEAPELRDLIVAGFAAGSNQAAKLIVEDVLDRPVFGFTRDDAQYVLNLQRQVGDRDALLKLVQFQVSAGSASPDLNAAVPLLDELSRIDGQSPAEIMRLAEKLDGLALPVDLSLRYVAPLFRAGASAEPDEAAYRANRILAAAAEAGLPEAKSLPPERVEALIKELRAAGARGHLRSLILLGDLYYTGIWVTPTYRQALDYYEEAFAISPDGVAKERVAKALLQIKSTPFEDERFETLIHELADAGSDWGRYRYGLLLISGSPGTPQDVAAGEDILLDLSGKAFVPAIKAMIERLRKGGDVDRMERALAVISDAWALRKDYRTGRQLGEFYILAGRFDDARAVLGHPMFARDADALLALARMELEDIPPNLERVSELAHSILGLTRDDRYVLEAAEVLFTLDLPGARQEGEAQLRQLADRGNADAMSLLVAHYIDTVGSDPAILPTLLQWSIDLAISGEVAPLTRLAATYLAQDADKAIAAQVLEAVESNLAALPADSYVAVLVAEAYYNGWGTEPDTARGNALIEAGAAAGNSDALAELGLQYFYGMGRPRQSDTAVALLESAAALGHGGARVELGRLNSSANGPSVDKVKAFSSFLDAANQGSSAGMLEVGRLYLAGWGIGRDEARGIEWLERAATLGDYNAMYQLYFHFHSKPDAKSQALAQLWLRRSVDADFNPAKIRLAANLLATEGNKPGTPGYDDAVTLLDDAFRSGYSLARKFSQTASDLDLPIPGEGEPK